jgi:cobalt-zinc-cadmium efflux system outer membrane protein
MRYLSAFLLLFTGFSCFAQESMTIQQCEASFLKNNLLLLAEQFNISASKAAVVQAKIWDQPYLSGEINAINPQDRKVFDVGNPGQKGLAIQQLIYLGGKKKNEVAFAQSNIAIAELQLEQLIRNLKFQINQDFYDIFFNQKSINALNLQISKLDTLLVSYQIQSDKNNIALKEVVRLQSLVLGLKNEKNTLQKETIEKQKEIQLITGVNNFLTPVVNEPELDTKYNLTKISKDSLLTIALSKNPDYLTAVKITENQDLFLKWQKSLSTPDLTLGLSYDQRGGAFRNQINVSFGIPLPVWNRNKGNIMIAEAQLNQLGITRDYKKMEIQNNIDAALQVWQQQQSQYVAINKSVSSNLESVYQGVLGNFQKRNITLLEFTDFIESYNQTTIQLNELKKGWVIASLNLNFVTNTEVF